MVTLYHAPHSCSLAVKAALTYVGLPHQIHEVSFAKGEHLTDEYRAINPLGKVPALKVEEEILTEGAAILLHLADLFPDSQLLPTSTSERAQVFRWMMFLYSNLHPHFSRVFNPGRFGSDTEDVKVKAETSIVDLFKIIDQQLQKTPFIAGSHWTIPDLYLMVAIHWQGVLSKSLTEQFPILIDYVDRMFSQNSIGQIYQSELLG